MKVAALDLGTNTFLCLIAEIENGKFIEICSDEAKVVRLGQGLAQTGAIHPEALVRAEICLREFAQAISKHRPDKTIAVATAAARQASNGAGFFSLVQELQIPIKIIPGEQEAEISFLGAVSGYKGPESNFLVLDIGGGSTEIIVGGNQKVDFAESINIGCVTLMDRFAGDINVGLMKAEATKMSEYIEEQLKPVLQKAKGFSIDQAIAVAGTPTSLAAAELGGFKSEQVEGYHLSLAGLTKWQQNLVEKSPQQISTEYGIEGGRADVILAGVIILRAVLQTLGLDSYYVSTRGVRFGVALAAEKGLL